MILINCKTYKNETGTQELLKTIRAHLPHAVVCPSPELLGIATKQKKVTIFSQHVDYGKPGRGTGKILISHLQSMGIHGSLLNHSEHRISRSEIKTTLMEAAQKKFKIILCIGKLSELKHILRLPHKPYAIAFEDPKLIGTGRSVTQYNPRAIQKFVKKLVGTGILPLCGAGISTAKDYHAAKALGCHGVLIASAIANKPNPTKLLKELR